MKTLQIILLQVILVASLIGSTAYTIRAEGVPKLINYQGKLTDAQGSPLANGTYGIAIKVWDKKDAAEPGKLVWGQEYSVAVQNGVFNVILGAPGGIALSNALVADIGLAFSEPNRFIGVTVTKGVNGVAITNPSEMLPRQQVLTAPYAVQAEYALNVVNSPIPRGVVVMWSGAISSIPQGWVLCNGQNGTPDLRDRFVVGANQDASGQSQTTVSGALTTTGGAAAHVLTIQELPPHSHTLELGGNGENENITIPSMSDGLPNRWTGVTGSTGGGQPHNNLPPYYALAFIMKL